MAGLLIAFVPSVEITLTANTTKTVLAVKSATNQRVVLRRFGALFVGASVTYLVRLKRIQSDGTYSALTGVLLAPGSDTPQTTGRHTYTVEPTAGGDILWHGEVTGAYESAFLWPDQIILPANTILGMQVTTPSGATGTLAVAPYFHVEE